MNLPSRTFLGLLRTAKYIIGNSSCGIIEAAYVGTPAIDIGSRQKGRGCSSDNVYPATTLNGILNAIEWARDSAGIYSSNFYGDGTANAQIYKHIKEWLNNA